MAAQPPLERKNSFSDRARRHRLHPGRDVEGRGRRRAVQAGGSPLAGNLDHRDGHGPRRQARAERIRDRCQGLRDRRPITRLSDYAQGARRRFPARPPSSVDPHRTAAGDPARAARSDQRDSSTRADSSSPTRRSSRPPRARGRRRSFRRSTSRRRRPI